MLQESEEQESEEENVDADVAEYASKIDEDDYNIIISMKEEQKTLGYQETMKVDVKNIAKNLKTYGDQYMKLLMLRFLKKLYISSSFLD